eukprot:TRINITY_DN81137_c0_g1_i1.p1 TRINITY_DN81137_c0_g1~~TRINITY_DN81137_c0_g1_i1.p1  ORF type:complete len:397 (-),score=70.90 TRINITY_DN81137_c0_g1_i1:65-1255(-)
MAAAASSSAAGDMQVYVLDLKDLASADICSWRLRAAPHLNADEVGVFRHGDRINALRDSEHSQWLRLTDGTGWVKECHEGNPVWQIEQNACTKAVFPSPAAMSCVKKDVAKLSETKTASPSSGSQSIPQGGHGLRDLMPLPFAGQGHSLGDQCQWFTGKSCKLGPDESREKVPLKQRWADVEDSDDSDSLSTVASLPRSSKVPISMRERWADMEDTDDEEDVSISGAPIPSSPLQGLTSQNSKDDTEKPLPLDSEVSTEASMPIEQQALRNPRRKKRNQALLARKNKTQLCQHLADKGFCPFGDDCWFAHSPSVLQTDAQADAIATSSPIELDRRQEEETSDSVSDDIRKPRQRARNQALLKRKNKTQFCRYLQDTGCCPFEGKCWFAHDTQEIQT